MILLLHQQNDIGITLTNEESEDIVVKNYVQVHPAGE